MPRFSASNIVMLSRPQVRLLLPLGTAMALSLTGDSTLYAVLANEIDIVGISLGVVGLLLGANRMIRIPGNLLAGALNDRMARRPLFLTGLCLGILSTLAYSLVRGFWPLLASRLLWGAAWSLINVGGYTMILDRSTPADRGRMTGLYQMAFMLGLAISPILGGVLTDSWGFRAAVRTCALVSALGLVVALFALPETRPPQAEPRQRFWAGASRLRLQQWLAGFRAADLRIFLASYVYFVAFLVNGGVLMSTIGLYLKQRWGPTVSLGGSVIGVASLTGGMLALRAVSGMVAGPISGLVSDRLGDRWSVVRGGILLGCGGFVILAFLGGVGAVPLGVAMVSLSAGAMLTALAALVGDYAAGRRQGVMMGALATAGDMGSAVGPPLAYALAVAVDLRWLYLGCALALASGLLATLWGVWER